ncbi:MAG TPA: PSD1 and planctomycete cytochrome C domain-containing protein [Fimbriiglobus sp.]|jgi:hypothetical protein
MKHALPFLLAWMIPQTGMAAEPPVEFNRDVRPILSDKCFNCHGLDAKARKAKLRLDTAAGAYADRDDNPAITPKDLAKSALWERINATDPDEVMPPPRANKTLTSAQKETLRRWIVQGAKYQKHWSFEPVRRPTPPAGASPIDAFLMQRIRSAGLTPQPEASKETLIRRVAFTLTGLPPTVKEVDEFFKDTSPNAYEKLVDRYLASPRYGEEMARHWLDVARYADTHGLHLDNERQMWLYRDWVVRAFNQNLPYDQFTVWQVAGDQLPNPTPDQLIATGFNRCNVTSSEGGAIDAEFAYRYAVERTSAVAQAWLGLTAGCAVCHDHKYDPLSQKEFYSLYAFFNSAADPAMDGNVENTPPFLRVPRPDLKAESDAAGRVEKEARAWLDIAASACHYSDPAARPSAARKAVREELFDDTFPIGSTSRSSSRNTVEWVLDPPEKTASGRRAIRLAHAVGCDISAEFKLRPIITPYEATVEFSVYVEPLDVPSRIAFSFSGKPAVNWTRTEKGLIRTGSKDAPIKPGVWTKLAIPAKDFGLKQGDRINGLSLSQAGGIVFWDAAAVVGQSDPVHDPLESFKVWRTTLGSSVPPNVPGELASLIRKGARAKLAPADSDKLLQFYLAVVARPATPALSAARTTWETARTARTIAEESAPGTFIFKDRPKPKDSFVMLRGQYDKPGGKVVPAGPAILPTIQGTKAEKRLSRLDLANWLVEKDQPLTARVTVNRLWQQVFGTGLVKTSFDFGTRGDPPSHPELLDWLAAEFVESHWDVKGMMKRLVLSEAFRRSAKVTSEVLAADPDNRLYARGPRIRLDAEQIRDNALAVSGLIDLTMGGRGVKPYQPANIWEPVGYSDSNTRFYQQDHGSALYRRSIYVFLKRTAPPPFLSTFDGPNREQVCIVRDRTNTPLQALQLLNDVQYFEAARALAERTLAENWPTDTARIAFLYRTVLARKPDAAEMKLVSAALAKQRALYAANPAAAKKVIAYGESKPRGVAPASETAAWTMIANLMLNLDETVTRN